MQQYTDIYSLQSYSTCFGFHTTSPGLIKTVTAASVTGHNAGTATFLQRGLIGIPEMATCGSIFMLH